MESLLLNEHVTSFFIFFLSRGKETALDGHWVSGRHYACCMCFFLHRLILLRDRCEHIKPELYCFSTCGAWGQTFHTLKNKMPVQTPHLRHVHGHVKNTVDSFLTVLTLSKLCLTEWWHTRPEVLECLRGQPRKIQPGQVVDETSYMSGLKNLNIHRIPKSFSLSIFII